MSTVKGQHYKFCYEAMPNLFHGQSKSFLTLLERDGKKFLTFWWDHAGEKMEEELRCSSRGLAYEVRKSPRGKTVVLVTLPAPQRDGEAHYLAMVHPPLNRWLFWKNMDKFYAMEKYPPQGGETRTMISEWTKRCNRFKIGWAPAPDLEVFYKTVLKLADK